MNETASRVTRSTRRKRLFVVFAVLVVLTAALGAAAVWLVNSVVFNHWVRTKVIEKLETVTGGRVELGHLKWSLAGLQLEAHDLTIHGLEAPDQIPYFHAENLYAGVRVISLLRGEIALSDLEVDRPVIHIIVSPDGSTNQPRPRIAAEPSSAVAILLDLRATRAEVKDGELVLNDRSFPLHFFTSDLAVEIAYNRSGERYDGKLRAGMLKVDLDGVRPITAEAAARFSLDRNQLQLTSLTFSSGSSQFEAAASMKDFASPVLNFEYHATIDLADADRVLRIRQLSGGVLQTEGKGTYKDAALDAVGKLSVRGLAWDWREMRLRDVSAGADYALDQDQLRFPHIFVHLLGGTATGNAVVDNWTSTKGETGTGKSQRETRGAEKTSAGQRGNIRLNLSGLSVRRIARVFSTRKLPLEKLNVAGSASGETQISWRGTIADAVADLNIRATPPNATALNELPISATLRGMYRVRPAEMQLVQANVTSPTATIDATGTLGRSAANLKLSASTTDLAKFAPIILAESGWSRMPADVHGEVAFEGSVSGPFKSPSVAGILKISNFEADTSVFGEQSGRQVHWDLFSGNIQYSPTLLAIKSGILQRGAARAKFVLAAQLQDGKFTPAAPLNGTLEVVDAPVSALQEFAGTSYPIGGSMNLSAVVAGTSSDLSATGHLRITKATIYGQPITRITSEVRFAGRKAEFNNIELTQNHARVIGTAGYNLADRSFHFDLTGRDFSVGALKIAQRRRLKATGTMQFSVQGTGTLNEPSISGNLSLTNLVINGEKVGNIKVQGQTVGDTLRLTAQSDAAGSDLRMEGAVHMRGDFPLSATAEFSHLDADPLLRAYLQDRLTGHSSFAGSINLHGSLKKSGSLVAEANLKEVFIPVEALQIRNQGPIRFAVQREQFDLRELHLTAEDTDFAASGTAGISAPHRLNLRANGRLNLKILQTIDSNFNSRGLVNMDVQIGGDLGDPVVNGRAEVFNGAISYIDWPNGLSDVNGKMTFDRDRLQIENITARTGGGTITLGGYIAYARGIAFNVRADARDIRLRYPPGVSANADATLRLTGGLKNAVISGDAVLTRFGVSPQFDLSRYVTRSKQPADLSAPVSALSTLRLDVHVTSTPGLQLQTSLAKLSGNVDLRVRGTAANPVLLGRIDIVEGDIFFNGTRYRLERGDITFTNPTRIEPILDIQATTRVRDYDITLIFNGPTDRLNTTYRSDPPLATADIIALLAFGRTREESALQPVSNQNFTETASNAILGQALNATVSSRVQRLFGVSRIKIDPEVGGAENNPSSARVTIEQQVANNLTITYITDLARSNQQIISAEYNLTRTVSIVAVRDQNGIVSFDVRIRQRKR